MRLPIACLFCIILPLLLLAGPYAPPAGQPGSTAISKDDPEIRYWASNVLNYTPGDAIDDQWKDTAQALGPAEGTAFDVVSLGRGGSIVLEFPEGISNGPGWDFVVFENAFDDFFLELAAVGVSSTGVTWQAFLPLSETPVPVSAFGQVDATNISNLAGKYRGGYGVPFDLSDLGVPDGATVDRANVSSVLLSDIQGDGSTPDSLGRPIYDPYPTVGSAGFDLDAIGVRYPRAFESIKVEGSEWSYTESIGWYVGAQFPWIYHQEHGTWYVIGNEAEGLWIWDRELGWLWTIGTVYPALYTSERGWIYFGANTDGNRFFNDLETGEWFSAPIN